jgi:hypothetical protein
MPDKIDLACTFGDCAEDDAPVFRTVQTVIELSAEDCALFWPMGVRSDDPFTIIEVVAIDM